jgi:hypothetical protein
MISNGSDTEKPSCVISPYLYIGSALAARSVPYQTLQILLFRSSHSVFHEVTIFLVEAPTPFSYCSSHLKTNSLLASQPYELHLLLVE